jgi:hypothetical protein
MWLHGGKCGCQCSWTKTLHDRRNSNLCGSQTQENTRMNEVGGSKESIRLTDDNLKQNGRWQEVIGQRCSMVKIPRAEPE